MPRRYPGTEAIALDIHGALCRDTGPVLDALAGRSQVLLRTVLAPFQAAGCPDNELLVAVVAPDGSGLAFSPRRFAGECVPAVSPPGEFPFGGEAPADRPLSLVTLSAFGRSGVNVRLDRFEGGQHQGFTMGRAAIVAIGGDGIARCGYCHLGVDVTDLVVDPVRSIAAVDFDTRGWAASELLPDPVHGDLLSIVAAAERRGEAIHLTGNLQPGLNVARCPGVDFYELIDDAELAARARTWKEEGTPVNRLTWSPAGDSSTCMLVRTVSGVVDGPSATCPAIVESSATDRISRPALKMRRFAHGRRLSLDPVQAFVESVARGSSRLFGVS